MPKLLTLALLPALFLIACTTEPASPQAKPGERPLISSADCSSQAGSVVGDIGNGRIHRDDFICPSGEPPIGTILFDGDQRPREGAVCCPM